ncbi:acetolactate synthase small subunit [bacterium]|nr:acetolactate synthase small subunit [bacterium]
MRHIISVLVENQSGVLTRIAGMFSSRGFNIDSLAVGETQDPTVSRITVVSHGDDQVIEQIVKQLRKLIDVIRVQDITAESHIERELLMVKVASDGATRGEVMQIVTIFRGRIVDVGSESVVIEMVGSQDRIQALLDLLEGYGVLEMARTGAIGLARGAQVLRV